MTVYTYKNLQKASQTWGGKRNPGALNGKKIIIIIIIKRDFLKHKTVKTNDKIRRFGVFMTPLSRKILKKDHANCNI